MGYGRWSDVDYGRTVKGKKAFSYSDDTLSKPRGEKKCHQFLNPYGLNVRESRDSAEHPESNAVGIGLDVTGSMGRVVVSIRDALGKLMEMLLGGKYIKDPQLLFYAVGDATCDEIPFQVSQFESDVKINDQLTKAVLEGGGGGQLTESYELGFYFAVRHTSIDCFEKRNKKGYLITIGDEMPYPNVSRDEVKKIFNKSMQEDIPLKEIVKEAQVKYNTFHIIPAGSNHYDNSDIRNAWAKVLGGKQFVFMLEDPTAVAETVAVAIGLNEGRITLEEGLKIVTKSSGQETATAVRNALEEFGKFAITQPKNRTASAKDSKTADSKDSKSKPKKEKKDWKL